MQPKSPHSADTTRPFSAPSGRDRKRRNEPARAKSSDRSLNSNWKAPFLFLWLVVSLPFVSYTMWRSLTSLQEKDWIALASQTRRLHKIGFMTRTTRYWLAIAYSNLNQWGEAIEIFENMSRPLETIADDAARYCAHVWALSEVGRVEEASELLIHSIREDWPEDRRNWAGRFLERHAEEGTAEFILGAETKYLH